MTIAITDCRAEIARAIDAGDTATARARLTELWRGPDGPSLARYIVASFERIAPSLPLTPYRLAIVRSFTLEPLMPMLRAAAFVSGIQLDLFLADFGTYGRDVHDPASPLYAFNPQAVILATLTRDIAPRLWDDAARLSADELRAATQQAVQDLGGLLRAFRRASDAHLIVHNLEAPAWPALGVLDAQLEYGQAAAIRAVNDAVALVAREQRMYVLDYDAVQARAGREAWHDPHKWRSARLPISAAHMPALVDEWLRFLHPLSGRVCKALVLDLDNTLWGGVIGEDGISGIALGPDGAGVAFHELQRAILDLSSRGVILAIASKNNRADALAALAEHPAMLLRPGHFAAMRIDWNRKDENIRAIAQELNIGTDAIAFLDDNPVERALVAAHLPEVTVLPWPDDLSHVAESLRRAPAFERLSLTDEDRQRGQMYAEQRQRAELEQEAGSLEAFYTSLQMTVEIAPVTEATLARVAQLTQKTNQFNLTTRRATEPQIAARMADAQGRVLAVRVVDRFGDNGLTGVVIVERRDDAWEIETFLLSCRVMGRTVETAILATLAEDARTAGCRYLRGWYLPTAKNAPVRDLYPAHGFAARRTDGEATEWELDLATATIAPPPWITRALLVDAPA